MNLDKFAGLKIVFNNSGKNPYGHDIEKCLLILARMKKMNTIGAILIAIGFVVLCNSIIFTEDFISFGFLSATLIFFVCLFCGIKIFRTDYGKNILSVADEWRSLLSRIEKFGVRAEGKDCGNDIAMSFELLLVGVAYAKIQAEKDGISSKIKEMDRLFGQIRDLALELRLNVSDREDFFTGKGKVEFSTYVTCKPTQVG